MRWGFPRVADAGVYVTRTGAFLPNAPVGNDAMERILGQVGARPSRARRVILRSNGILTRHYAIDPVTLLFNDTNAGMTAKAVRGLVPTGSSLPPIGCLACGTSIADQLMPGHGVMVQGELGLPACEVVSTSGVCVASMTALKYACMAVATGQHQVAVATGSELSSARMKADVFSPEFEAVAESLDQHPELAFEKDFLRWMLSDGAGAVLLESTPRTTGISLRVDWLDILSYAGETETCMYAGAVKQADGRLRGWQQFSADAIRSGSVMAVMQDVKLLHAEVVRHTVEKPLGELTARRGLRASEIDYFLPHYSSLYFREKLQAGMRTAGLDIPFSRWFTTIETCGNAGSASIYIMLDALFRSGRIASGQRLLCFVPESGRFSSAFLHLTAV
jgi:3-oxoacyl-[acyl-carrier-protein] synthase-3